MQLALSTTIAPPPVPVRGELSGNSCQGFTTKNQTWNPGPNVVNSTTAIGFWPSLFLEGFRQSHSARYYNTMTGRFSSRDPEDGWLTNPATLHKYLYAEGDPVNGTDPSGRADTIEYPRLFVIAAVATTGVIALRSAINCSYTSNGTRTSSTVYAGAFGQVSYAGSCTWDGTPPTVYPLPFPFPISIPAGGPGNCPSGEEWHHLVPQEFRSWANKCEIPIDTPGLGMCMPGKCHQRVHGGSSGTDWNTEWYQQIYEGWGGDCPE